MPNLLAMSFEGELAPSFTLRCLEPGRELPDGWGMGYYPAGEPSAAVLKEPAPRQSSMRSQLALAWEQVESKLFVLQIRRAKWGAASDANTQPFSRAWGRRDWLFAHAGSLEQRPDEIAGPFEPVGSTDTEQILCGLLNRFVERGWKSVAEVDLDVLQGWLDELNQLGELTICLSDGRDLLLRADRRGVVPLWLGEMAPPFVKMSFGDEDLVVDLSKRGAEARRGVIATTEKLEAGDRDAKAQLTWRQLVPGQLVVVREGTVITERVDGKPLGAVRAIKRPMKMDTRTYDIVHRTEYHYDKPVTRSIHILRLAPVYDRFQRPIHHALTVNVPGQSRDYNDVFNNRVRRLVIDTEFTDMIIESRSTVEVSDVDPLAFGSLHLRSTFPLVWMPWQRQVLEPFLLPVELPETELAALADYAMTFVKRNDYDLLDTLLDINQTIQRDYKYESNSTSLSTTAYQTYTNRKGVCQDFANLMICLSRLLGVPARYTCGYVYTGPKAENRIQSEASHAWVQVYLPQAGWKGFDPTNGTVTQTEHVRVAVGRNYNDATPTSGTIFLGGGGETMTATVTVEPHAG